MENVHNLYNVPHQILDSDWINKAGMGGTCSTHGENQEITEGNVSLGKFKCGWEDNIKMRLREVECEGVDWVHVC